MKENYRANRRPKLPKKRRVFAEIARWLHDVQLLCSRVEAPQPLAWWVAVLGLFARLL